MTTWLFLAFLVGASLAICIPAGMRARRNSPFSAAQLFKKRLATFSPRSRAGRWIITPDRAEVIALRLAQRRATRKRAALLTAVLVLATVSGLLAIFIGDPFLWVHLAADGVALICIAYLYETARRRKEREAKVRPLAPRRGARAGLYPPLQTGSRR